VTDFVHQPTHDINTQPTFGTFFQIDAETGLRNFVKLKGDSVVNQRNDQSARVDSASALDVAALGAPVGMFDDIHTRFIHSQLHSLNSVRTQSCLVCHFGHERDDRGQAFALRREYGGTLQALAGLFV